MSRFIAFDQNAVENIISSHAYQSVEFEIGDALAATLLDPSLNPNLGVDIRIEHQDDGLFIISTKNPSKNCVIFDLDTTELFNGAVHDRPSALLFLQKVLRFTVKQWNGLSLSITERPIQNSSKVVIFPFPISKRTSYRISVELTPDEERLAKRPAEGRCILVYKSGFNEGDGAKEQVSPTNFRRFIEARRNLPAQSTRSTEPKTNITSLQITSLSQPYKDVSFPSGGYDQWMHLLTKKQSEFVFAPLKAPHRIEGPAGTGKTLSLVLKSIATLREARSSGSEYRALFITHSDATRTAVEQLFAANDKDQFAALNPLMERQTLKLTTLHQFCGEILGREIHESELLDSDALESKQLQVIYVTEALDRALEQDLPTYQNLISPEFLKFLIETDKWALAEMVQHEISVVIKGRSGEQLDNYRMLPRLRYGLPVETSSDRGFVWMIFLHYQDQLKISAQFDTDDVVLTTIGQLDTPIWRRRRLRDGYDGIFIDESHLFNVNELSVFHLLTKTSEHIPIAYSADRSQAIGDRDWSDEGFDLAIAQGQDGDSNGIGSKTHVNAVFRCSPDIVGLAFSVTSAGATLFTNFDDPLKVALSMFTHEEEMKCARPSYTECAGDVELVSLAYSRAEQIATEMRVSRGQIALIAFSNELFQSVRSFGSSHNKPIEVLDTRGDIEAVQRAERSGRFIVSTPEYVGGLEFSAVLLIGVDEGRVPPAKSTFSLDSSNFLNYAAHNRLYVSITRAKYRVDILASKERGISSLLKSAVANDLLEKKIC